MAVVEISVVPLGTSDPSVSPYVADCLRIARDSGLHYTLTAMGTILQGEIEAILQVVRQMHEAPFAAGAARVYTVVKIDDRRDGREHSIEEKVQSVEEKM